MEQFPSFIQKFTATYFKLKQKKKRDLKKTPEIKKNKDFNRSFCIDLREQAKYLEPKLSASFFIN